MSLDRRLVWTIVPLVVTALVGCSSPVDKDVPTSGDTKGHISVKVDENPPYPPTAKQDQKRLQAVLLAAAARAGQLPAAGQNQYIAGILQQFNQISMYGPAFNALYTSKLDSNGAPLTPNPKFVQLVRATLDWKTQAGAPLGSKSAQQTAADRIWTQQGGQATADGWTVDKVPDVGIGSDPIYGDETLPGLFQFFDIKSTEMFDVPGLQNPWTVPALQNTVVTDDHEFQAWIAAPAPTPAASSFSLFGYVHWSYEAVTNVGTSKATTTMVVISSSSYTWVDSTSTTEYVTLMQNNYPAWAPPP